MKNIVLIIGFVLTSHSLYTQHSFFVKGRGYEGYIFPKEHFIWGFHPENNRYTLDYNDVIVAEKILKDSIGINYIKSFQKSYRKPPIRKNTLKRYMRQYVGYITDKNEIVVWINLFSKKFNFNRNPSLDIISLQGGGCNFWSININISTKELSDMKINGS